MSKCCIFQKSELVSNFTQQYFDENLFLFVLKRIRIKLYRRETFKNAVYLYLTPFER